jgi:hypothetical protein
MMNLPFGEVHPAERPSCVVVEETERMSKSLKDDGGLEPTPPQTLNVENNPDSNLDTFPETAASEKMVDGLEPRDQALIASLTANRQDYKAESQDQALRERERHWLRRLFKRLDHGRWRDAKNKYVAYGIVIVGVLVLWNYWPKPNLTAVALPHATLAPVRQAGISSVDQPMPNSRPSLAITPAPKRLERPKLEVKKPAMNPVPNLEPVAPVPVRQTSAIPVYNPPAPIAPRYSEPVLRNNENVLSSSAARSDPVRLEQFSAPILMDQKPLKIQASSPPMPVAPIPMLERNPGVAGDKQLEQEVEILVNRTPENSESAPPTGSGTNGNADAPSQGVATLMDRGGSSPSTTEQASTQVTENPYPPGTKLKATLLTGVLAVPGNQDFPVIAKLEDGGMVFGKATLDSTMRIQVRFLEVARDGSSSSISAQALDLRGYPGLSGDVREEAPDVVNNLLRAAVGGVSSYVEALTKSGTTSFSNGATSVSNPAPNLGWSILGNIANLFQVPNDQRALVKVVELKPDSPLTVLFMPARP